MADQLTATAAVRIEAPARYVKQLASHMGRRTQVHEEADGTRIMFAGGSCLLRSGPGSLDLIATADSADALESVMDVVGRHVERFGQRSELHVDWTRD